MKITLSGIAIATFFVTVVSAGLFVVTKYRYFPSDEKVETDGANSQARAIASQALAERNITIVFSDDENSDSSAMYAVVGRATLEEIDWKNLAIFPEIRGFEFLISSSVSVRELAIFRNVEQISFFGLTLKLAEDDWHAIFQLSRLSMFAFPMDVSEKEYTTFREHFPSCVTQPEPLDFLWVPDNRGLVMAAPKFNEGKEPKEEMPDKERWNVHRE